MDDNNKSNRGSYLAIGISLGSAFGIIFKNLPLGLSLGIIFGVLASGSNSDE
ncbi:MAG: hypothetical protein ACTHVE_06500 [Senegalia sp. (in: firmicutes)]|uniref:hypothetical protein n=1 Tax=Senegalia sp. (in: firmicutes) TaxID=1924098 RepID=UPI003F9DB99E